MVLSSEPEPIKATLEIVYDSEEGASLTLSALSPDNVPLPEGLRLSMRVEGCKLVSEIECRRPISSLLNTLDDILSMASLIKKTVLETKRLQSKD
ncbi:MAG: KEOPS complex subunit Pcc1 [Nitrososphaerota archaeon]|nr:KEOPS complex subunit Pcc1 [Aigarchaeota archaeon]MDW8076742.1 KEOPS complex subunit Pcc1 [Nitrososphaerota archaeon]